MKKNILLFIIWFVFIGVTLYAAGDLIVNGNLIVDPGSVGVGTSTPAEKLDVVGNINASGDVTAGGSINSVGNLTVQGNLGIGTNTPTEKLDVNGNMKVGGELATSSGHLVTERSDGALVLDAGPADAANTAGVWFRKTNVLGDVSSYVDLMRVTDAGNVGIGTTEPTEKLEINGNISFKVDGVKHVAKPINQNLGEDSYGGWISGSPPDSCDGSTSAEYSCPANAKKTCTDSHRRQVGWVIGYYYRTVTCKRPVIFVEP